uniref:RING-type domain-containing protein n=1 Tax=Populus trichocarpa TaxID=3694 RepID=B9NBY4_POPTR
MSTNAQPMAMDNLYLSRKVLYTRVIKVEEGYAKQPCAVCFEELLIGGKAILLPCSHVYHCGCIRKWFKMIN